MVWPSDTSIELLGIQINAQVLGVAEITRLPCSGTLSSTLSGSKTQKPFEVIWLYILSECQPTRSASRNKQCGVPQTVILCK